MKTADIISQLWYGHAYHTVCKHFTVLSTVRTLDQLCPWFWQ